MEPKYVEAIKAGIIGGILLAGLALLSQLASLMGYIKAEDYTTGTAAIAGVSAVLGCCVCILFVVVLAGTGALAVRMANLLLRDLNDAVLVSAIAGAVAGLIWGIVSIVLDMLAQLLGKSGSGVAGSLAGSLFAGICGLLCCVPAAMVLSVVIAVAGGATYWSIMKK
jgi:hypothetical protein